MKIGTVFKLAIHPKRKKPLKKTEEMLTNTQGVLNP